ncbi:MAG: HAD family hydrolase [Treponema sp.]|nr:HAD family hydrolase [Treponema sp.]
MRVFRVPGTCRAIIFDMDSTLYTNDEYARAQIDLPIERLARLKGKSPDEMRAEIDAYREKWAEGHRGQKISLANAFVAFGVGIAESAKWRNELFNPERYLRRDARLRFTLENLANRFIMAVVTNNPARVAERTLDALGVGDLFHAVVGLDTCGVSKPHREPFIRAATLCGVAPEACLSVGDRYDIDIALPLELGMGGILVDGVGDVYGLPELLSGQEPHYKGADLWTRNLPTNA